MCTGSTFIFALSIFAIWIYLYNFLQIILVELKKLFELTVLNNETMDCYWYY